MENASKALIMAGSVLIGILIMSLAVYLFVDFGTTSAQINEQNAQTQITQFNSKFTSYQNRNDITIYDIITLAAYAKENNKYYDNDNAYKIVVKIGNNEIQNNRDDQNYILIKNDQGSINAGNSDLPIYECESISYNNINGRVNEIKFKKQ